MTQEWHVCSMLLLIGMEFIISCLNCDEAKTKINGNHLLIFKMENMGKSPIQLLLNYKCMLPWTKRWMYVTEWFRLIDTLTRKYHFVNVVTDCTKSGHFETSDKTFRLCVLIFKCAFDWNQSVIFHCVNVFIVYVVNCLIVKLTGENYNS